MPLYRRPEFLSRHREERSDVAIQRLDLWIATPFGLAMTGK
jgi:hypothetical protein